MATIQHPAAQEEQHHLQETRRNIDTLTSLGQEEMDKATEELTYARGFDPDMLPLREMMFARAQQNLRNLSQAMLRPYFTRIDFTESSSKEQVYYIGKHGLVMPDLTIAVVDWRSPVANLYYSGQVGPMRYEAPDGVVEGELTLKRQFTIENGELTAIFDTGVVAQDAYLQSVLGAASGDRLRDIVTTIQSEQNLVIRHPMDVSLVVQGVAGSGKTTIALHRIAYLLYAYQDRLQPEHMLILAPNPLFLNFIAGVLPDLGVERVRQTTFQQFVADWMDKLLPRVQAMQAPESVPDLADDELEKVASVAHFKGSLTFLEKLENYLDHFEQSFSPPNEIKFGAITLYTPEQLKKYLLVDEKPFPLTRRLTEFKKDLTARARNALNQIIQWLEEETDRRTDRIRRTLPDTEQRRLKLVSLYNSRDQRIREAKDRLKPFIRETLSAFPNLTPISLYRDFWQKQLDEKDCTLHYAAEMSLSSLSRNRITPEDIAPLALIALRTHELPRLDIRHIVIDEAQDFNLLEFLLLRRMTHGAPMTIVGDLMQGVRAWCGISDWQDLTEHLFHGKAVMRHLLTSYRNTIEIMSTALRVARKRPIPGQQEAKPVLRHGPEPVWFSFSDSQEQTQEIQRLVRQWQAEGMQSIAIIDRTTEQLTALLKKLPAELNAVLLDVNASEYAGSVTLARAADVKGFEFDGVIMADASEAHFSDRDLDARLLYVSLTRPLHRLACLYHGQLTPLLS